MSMSAAGFRLMKRRWLRYTLPRGWIPSHLGPPWPASQNTAEYHPSNILIPSVSGTSSFYDSSVGAPKASNEADHNAMVPPLRADRPWACLCPPAHQPQPARWAAVVSWSPRLRREGVVRRAFGVFVLGSLSFSPQFCFVSRDQCLPLPRVVASHVASQFGRPVSPRWDNTCSVTRGKVSRPHHPSSPPK
jgi:hypothetical protein